MHACNRGFIFVLRKEINTSDLVLDLYGITEISSESQIDKKRKTELSNTLYDTAIVFKNYEPEVDNTAPGVVIGALTGHLYSGIILGMLFSEKEQHRVFFKGKKVSFNVDDAKLFHSFNEGDTVKLSYREVYEILDPEQPFKRTLMRYEVISAEKIN